MANVINSEQISLQLTRHYPFPPTKVFRAWTDPQALKAWFAPDPAFDLPEAEVDLRVGGRYRLLLVAPNGERHWVSGTYREVLPPVRLVFTWSWADRPERESLVTVELRDRDGGTELVLTHQHFHDDEDRGKHEHGWNANLNRLGQLAL